MKITQKKDFSRNNIRNGDSSSWRNDLVKNNILGVNITNEREDIILEYIINIIEKDSLNFFIVTPNPEMVMAANASTLFKNTLNNAKIALCDGVGLLYAGQLLGQPFKQRITGVDFMKRLCEKINDRPITVGFLGGRGNVAEETSECLKKHNPSLKVVFVDTVWKDDQPHEKIDILFVAFGHPKQEVWMESHLNTISVRVMIGVGGSFDYLSGAVTRAPKLIQVIGFEWLYRLISQPWRWKRQISLIKFIILVFAKKIEKMISSKKTSM